MDSVLSIGLNLVILRIHPLPVYYCSSHCRTYGSVFVQSVQMYAYRYRMNRYGRYHTGRSAHPGHFGAWNGTWVRECMIQYSYRTDGNDDTTIILLSLVAFYGTTRGSDNRCQPAQPAVGSSERQLEAQSDKAKLSIASCPSSSTVSTILGGRDRRESSSCWHFTFASRGTAQA